MEYTAGNWYEQRNRFSLLFQKAPAGLSVADTEGTILEVNPAFCRFTGYSEAEVVGAKVWEITHPEDRKATIGYFKEVAAGKRDTFTYEKRYLCKDGSVFWALVSVDWFVDENGQATHCVALIQDISARKHFEEGLKKSEMLYRTLVENVDLGINLIDRDMNVQMVNSTVARWIGKPMPGFVGKKCFRQFEKRVEVCEHCPGVRAMNSGKAETEIAQGVREDGSKFTVRLHAFPLFNESGQADRFIEVIEDITEQHEAREALERSQAALAVSEERYRSIFEQSPMGVTIADLGGSLLDVNPAFCAFLGYSREELLSMTVEDVTWPADRDLTRKKRQTSLRNAEHSLSMEKRYRRKDGTVAWGFVTVFRQVDGSGAPVRTVGLVQDITERKQAEDQVRYMSFYDPLTGLPNRTLLVDRLEHALAGARRKQRKVAVMCLDLDRFRNINKTFGQQIGDEVLVQAGRRLAERVRQEDTLARFGDDEFVIVLEDIQDARILNQLAKAILERFKEPMTAGEHTFYLTPSIGISVYPRNGLSAEDLLHNADTAMLRARDAGRNKFEYSRARTEASVEENRRLVILENSLHDALEKEEFSLHYQPQFDFISREVVGFEGLLRWDHPREGEIPPGEFIPLAEQRGLIIPIGEWAMREACKQAKAWHDAGRSVRMAVNVSPIQFKRTDFVLRVQRVLYETGLDPQCLELEITEGMIMHNVERAIYIMKQLKNMGISLAIDDFGTGYSSLYYLKQFPIQRVKIDRSFIHDAPGDSDSAAVAESIIALAGSMDLEVVAEGIETEAQFEFLLQGGCRLGQGFLFARPAPADQIGFKF